MAKHVNYGFEKRQRELDKQKKKQEKAKRRKLENGGNPAQKQGNQTSNKGPLSSGPPDRN